MRSCIIEKDGRPLVSPAYIADGFFTRLRGLMLKKELAPGEGLLLKNCPQIHCFFMRFPIDAVYLDEQMLVTGIETVAPWHLGKRIRGTRHTLEIGAGRGKDLRPGMKLHVTEEDER